MLHATCTRIAGTRFGGAVVVCAMNVFIIWKNVAKVNEKIKNTHLQTI